MPATFGKGLIFNVHACASSFDVFARHKHCVNRIAKSCIRIGHQRNFNSVGDVACQFKHFTERNKGHVRKAKYCGRQAKTAGLNNLKARLFNKFGGKNIMGSRRHDGSSFRKNVTQSC